jgi:hypothetical protein
MVAEFSLTFAPDASLHGSTATMKMEVIFSPKMLGLSESRRVPSLPVGSARGTFGDTFSVKRKLKLPFRTNGFENYLEERPEWR